MASKPYNPQDAFYRKARQEGLRARSAYKIEEIDRRFGLFGKGKAVLDLGAAPGGWLQIIARRVGRGGVVVGIDLQPIPPMPPPVQTAVLDIFAPDLREQLSSMHEGAWDVVTSDMAPKTTGVKATDEARSLELAEHALELAEELLRPGGAFVAKVFEGGDFESYLRKVKASFKQVKLVRPEATRGRSFEIYVVGIGRKADGSAPGPAGGEPAPRT